jgi:hypothetical protein
VRRDGGVVLQRLEGVEFLDEPGVERVLGWRELRRVLAVFLLAAFILVARRVLDRFRGILVVRLFFFAAPLLVLDLVFGNAVKISAACRDGVWKTYGMT